MRSEDARFLVSWSAHGPLVRAIGELDIESAPVFAHALEAFVDEVGEAVIDLSGVTFMDSSGLQVLCRTAERAPVRLLAVPKRLRSVISMAGLDETFAIDPGPSDALSA